MNRYDDETECMRCREVIEREYGDRSISITLRDHLEFDCANSEREWSNDEVAWYVGIDGGDAPCSPYGRRASQWQPIALAFIDIMMHGSGDSPTPESMDHAIGLVVNGHPDVSYNVREYGPLYGYNPVDLLE